MFLINASFHISKFDTLKHRKVEKINAYIMTALKNKVDCVFDNTVFLGEKANPEKALYGGHPNEKGCKVWADALLSEIIEKGIL